jgi:hypothetical protein
MGWIRVPEKLGKSFADSASHDPIVSHEDTERKALTSNLVREPK